MPAFDVLLETAIHGATVAHVRHLPGCYAVGGDRDSAVSALPDAIRDYLAWLVGHGETIAMPDTITLTVVEARTGTPFSNPGNAATFSSDNEPVEAHTLATALRRAQFIHDDLLAMAGDLPGTMMGWQPPLNAVSVRSLLHQLAACEDLLLRQIDHTHAPPDDEASTLLPIAPLELIWQRAMTLLRDSRTRHRNALWPVRKVLRLLLVGKRKTATAIAGVLAQWRRQALAEINASRAALLWQMAGLPLDVLNNERTADGWTAKDRLANVAYWDERHTTALALLREGRGEEIDHQADTDAHSATVKADRHGWPFEQALAVALKTRSGFRAELARTSDHDLHRPRHMPNGDEYTLADRICELSRNERAHADALAAWRTQHRPATTYGPKALLRAMMSASRKEVMTLMQLVPEDARMTQAVCGLWTVRDLAGHLADRERLAQNGLKQMAVRGAFSMDSEGDNGNDDAWNAAHVAARQGQDWQTTWAACDTSRRNTIKVLDSWDDEILQTPIKDLYARETSNYYNWMLKWITHDREHAADLREALALHDLVPS